jgi:magnesium chelatase family protein
VRARLIQEDRFKESIETHCNAQMSSKELRKYCAINESGNAILKQAMDNLGLSARAYDRILKVARTIADLDNSSDIKTNHIAEAIQFRNLDREDWAK